MKKIDLEYNENDITNPGILTGAGVYCKARQGIGRGINPFKKRQKKAVFVSLNHGLTG